MKFEKITDTKIKIFLSLRDMELNNVSAESIFSNSASSQKLCHQTKNVLLQLPNLTKTSYV